MTEQTQSKPLSALDLDEIDARAAHLYEYATLNDEPLQDDADRLTGTDVPALLDAVRALTGQRDQARRIAVALEQENARLQAERDEFCNRVDALTAVAKGNKRHVACMYGDLQEAIRERNKARTKAREYGELAARRESELLTLRPRVAELERERAKYVGAEPTIAEEMAYLAACTRAVAELQLPDTLKVDSISGDYRNGYVHALADMRMALAAPERTSYPPAVPWAALMDDDDLDDFLNELSDSAAETGRDALRSVEDSCARWRAIAEAQHAHNTAPGPDAEAGETR